MTLLRRLLQLACVSATLVASNLGAQQPAPADRLRGLVRGVDSTVISNAQITVTPAGSGATQSVLTRSGADGKWSVTMPSRSSEYFVTISAIGWIQQRINAKPDTSPVITVDVMLKRNPVQLAAVKVTAQIRQPVGRDLLIGSDVAGTEKGVLASSEVFGVADQGDLVGMIAQVPGVSLTPDANGGAPSFSVLGLSASQNNVTLNGLAFGGGEVPRDIGGLVRVTTNSYDVSRGG